MPPARRRRLPGACWWGEVRAWARLTFTNRFQVVTMRYVLWGTQLQALGAVMVMEEELGES
jgi:hypothetical protein